MTRRWILPALLGVLVVAGCALGGCAQRATTESAPGGVARQTAPATTGPGFAQPRATDIPPGRSFAEGGGGPKSYTFREEWRRALKVARQWRKGAYLVTASGNNVNSDGVPSLWSMKFVNAIPTDEILVVEVDPWGNISSQHKVSTAKVTDLLQPGDGKIPYGVLDSDAAVAAGRAALAKKHDLATTSNPALRLEYARAGTGPHWVYYVEEKSPTYFTAEIDALTGAATVAR
jgi:hypothetical protein